MVTIRNTEIECKIESKHDILVVIAVVMALFGCYLYIIELNGFVSPAVRRAKTALRGRFCKNSKYRCCFKLWFVFWLFNADSGNQGRIWF